MLNLKKVINVEFLKKIINKYQKRTIPIEDLTYLNELIKTSLPLKSCLMLITNNLNRKLFESLLHKLDEGQLIENIVLDYMPKEINGYMNNLLKRLSFAESLNLSLSFYTKNKENSKALEKAITYPLILLFISLTGLYLFDSYGLDSILNLMRSFNANIETFSIFRIFLKILIYVFYFAFLIIAIIVLIFINPKRITLFYILLTRYFPLSIVKTYFTEDFISLFVITLNLGYKTKAALEILKSLNNKPLVAFLAFHLDDKLIEGASLKEASEQNYFDDLLVKFINIASYTNNFTGILNNYAELSREKIKNKMKTLTTIMQLASYLVIGIVIVFIYQVLFLPMQAITTL